MPKIEGERSRWEIKESNIGGYVAVFDSQQVHIEGILPNQSFENRWVVMQITDTHRSKRGITRATLREAKELAISLADGTNAIKLKKLTPSISEVWPASEKQSTPQAKDTQTEKSKAKKTGSKQDSTQKSRARDPSPPLPPLVQFTQEDLNKAIQLQLGGIGIDKVKTVLEDTLGASSTIWVDKLIEDPETGEMKLTKTTELIPDHKTRLAGATKILEYLIGRPIERTEVIERKEVDYTEIKTRLAGSKIYRDELRRLLDVMEREDKTPTK